MLENYITSFVDGRVRLRHPALKEQALAEKVRCMLPTVQGILTVEINERTGSLLATYDTEVLDKDKLLELLHQWESMGIFNAHAKAQAVKKKCSISWPHVCRRVNLRRLLNGGMLASLLASSVLATTGRKGGHALTGGLFLALSAVHVWNVRKSM